MFYNDFKMRGLTPGLTRKWIWQHSLGSLIWNLLTRKGGGRHKSGNLWGLENCQERSQNLIERSVERDF